MECVWLWPTDNSARSSLKPHKHDYGEILAFFDTNWDNPKELGTDLTNTVLLHSMPGNST